MNNQQNYFTQFDSLIFHNFITQKKKKTTKRKEKRKKRVKEQVGERSEWEREREQENFLTRIEKQNNVSIGILNEKHE